MAYSPSMELAPELCYLALLSHDRRFDGRFFVGVTSTGIYCRVVCPVRAPRRENCRFFEAAARAEGAGFRPCLRCRPELAPGMGAMDLSGRLAHAAATLIDEGFLDTHTVAELAARVGVTPRHLRRLFQRQYGVSMIAHAQTQRLLLAKRLLTDTSLSAGEVAMAAGFGSVRRFNHLFASRYGMSPLRLRRACAEPATAHLRFPLAYRPPFHWPAMSAFLARRAIAGVEQRDAGCYRRTVVIRQATLERSGVIDVRPLPQRHALQVVVSSSLAPVIAQVPGRVARLFDLSARPDLSDAHLGKLAADAPGLRAPGAFDGFEMAVRAIVG